MKLHLNQNRIDNAPLSLHAEHHGVRFRGPLKGPWWGPGANPQWAEPPEAAVFFGYGELSFDIILYISQVANAL